MTSRNWVVLVKGLLPALLAFGMASCVVVPAHRRPRAWRS